MFKERIVITVKAIFSNMVVGIIFPMVLVLGGLYLFFNYPIVALILKVIAVLFALILVVLLLYIYIAWQFVEPYQDWKKKKKEGNK